MNNSGWLLYTVLITLQISISATEIFANKNWPKAVYWFAAAMITFSIFKMK